MAFYDYYGSLTPAARAKLAEKMNTSIHTIRAYAFGARPITLKFADSVCKADRKFDPKILLDSKDFRDRMRSTEQLVNRLKKRLEKK